MPNHCRLAVAIAFSFAAAGLPGPLAGQQPLPAGVSLAALGASPIRSGPTAADGSSAGTWACGRNYKVSFHDGMTFYPYVGPDLPHQPLHWRTVSVRAGDVELLHGASPSPRCSDFRCEYEFGPVTERYDVGDDGLEQSFVVHQRPPAGDLVLVGEVTSPLALSAVDARHGPLSLRLPDGRAVIDYGAAVAIDHNGVRTRVATATDGKRIVLRVAAEVVAAAAFPLVIDPILTTGTVLANPVTNDDVDVLHETVTAATVPARMWFAFSHEVAAGDRDVRLWRTGSDYTGAFLEQYREISTWDSTHPRLALAPGAGYVVLVFHSDTGTTRSIGVHRHPTADTSLGTVLAWVAQPVTGVSDWRPDVGGRLQPNGNKVLITFQREQAQPWANTDNSTVYATVFDASSPTITSGFVVPPFVVLQRPNADQERPVVNQSAASNNWLLAFQELNNNVSNDDWDITTVAVDGGGVVTPTQLDTDSGPDATVHSITPEIAGAYGRYLLTYTTRDWEQLHPRPSGEKGRSVHAQRLDFDHGSGTGSLPHPGVELFASPVNVLTNAGSAFDSVSLCHWCTGMKNDALDQYRFCKHGYTGNVVEAATIALANGEAPESLAVTFQTEPRQFPVVFSRLDVANGHSLLMGNKMVYAAVPAPTLIGSACGTGVWTGLTAIADREQIGAENMPLHLIGAPEDSVAFVMISSTSISAPADAIGATGCTIVPDIVDHLITIIPALIQNGDSTVRISLPEYAGGVTLWMQWGYFVTGGNPLGIQASEGLRVTVSL